MRVIQLFVHLLVTGFIAIGIIRVGLYEMIPALVCMFFAMLIDAFEIQPFQRKHGRDVFEFRRLHFRDLEDYKMLCVSEGKSLLYFHIMRVLFVFLILACLVGVLVLWTA